MESGRALAQAFAAVVQAVGSVTVDVTAFVVAFAPGAATFVSLPGCDFCFPLLLASTNDNTTSNKKKEQGT